MSGKAKGKGKGKGKRRPVWTPAIGAARFATATAQAAAAANPTPLTESDQAFIGARMDAAVAALWSDTVDEQHLYDLCEGLNITKILVEAGAAQDHIECVWDAVEAGAEVRAAWDSRDKTSGTPLATPQQIQVIQEALEVHRGILAGGLYGCELLTAMKIMRTRQRAGQIVRVGP